MLNYFLGFFSATIILWAQNKYRKKNQRYSDRRGGVVDLSGTRMTNTGVTLRRVGR